MTEEQIREDKVLEFKALTMSKRVFDQLDEVPNSKALRVVQAEGGTAWVGRVNVPDAGEWFIVRAISGLARVRGMVAWDFITQEEVQSALDAGVEVGTDQFRDRVGRDTIQARYDVLRETVPQIFLK